VKTQRTRRDDQICALQRRVSLRGLVGQLWIGGKQIAHLRGEGKELRQLLVKKQIVSDHHRYRRRHRFIDISRRERRPQSGFRFRRTNEEKARRASVGTRRSQLQQSVQLAQRLISYGLIEPCIVRARIAKYLVQRFSTERRINWFYF